MHRPKSNRMTVYTEFITCSFLSKVVGSLYIQNMLSNLCNSLIQCYSKHCYTKNPQKARHLDCNFFKGMSSKERAASGWIG